MGRADGDDEHHRLPLGALRRFHNGMEKEPKLLRPRDAALGPLGRFRNYVEKEGTGRGDGAAYKKGGKILKNTKKSVLIDCLTNII